MRLLSLFAIFVSLALITRISLASGGYVSGWEAWIADLLTALLLALLCSRLHWALVLSIWLLWGVVYLGNLAFLQAMGSAVDHRDLGYLVDPAFLGATLGDRLLPILVLTPLLLVAAASLVKLCLRLPGPGGRSNSRWAAMALCLLLLALQANLTRLPQWSNSGLVPLHAREILSDILSSDTLVPASDFVEPEAVVGKRTLALGKARNVLLVVVEGVHGAYLPQVAADNNEALPVSMSLSEAWAQQGLLVPDFLVHVRQTNRGLYAMLCGDYPRLDGGHPKSMQILNADEAAGACLPAMLARAGYNTSYMQAADLQFMSKDLVMPQLGFEQVTGEEGYPDRGAESGTGFSWGPDDDAFFQQSIPRLQALQAQGQPYFATLLTVGTHYPYGVTAQQIEEHGDPRAAAVAAADAAVDHFLQQLQARGLLEDTLVIVTNDESHGIPGHWLGKNWGLLFALAPDLQSSISTEIFSSIDIPNSILDYLGLYPQQRTHLGRSLFRQHDQRRAIMLGGDTLKMLDADGLVHSCTNRVARDGSNLADECVTMKSESGRLFDREYEPLAGDHAQRYQFFWQRLLDSLYRFRESKDWTLLAGREQKHLQLAADNLALAHNRVTLPEDSLLTVDFEIEFEGDPQSSLWLEWAQYGVMGRASTLPALWLPQLLDGDSLRVRYVLPHYGEAIDAELVLKQRKPSLSGELQLKNYRYALQPQEGGRQYNPRVHIESSNPRLATARFSFEPAEEGPGHMQPIVIAQRHQFVDVFAGLGDLQAFATQSCEARKFSAIEQRIMQAYLVYYNRPADPEGLAYWAQRVRDYRYQVGARPAGNAAYVPAVQVESGIDEDAYRSVIRAFSSSDEYTRYFSNLDTEQLVANLFEQLFNQPAPAQSLQHYSDEVKAGALSRELVAMDIVRGANAQQQRILNNRLLASQWYSSAAEGQPDLQVNAPYLSQLITEVGSSEESLAQACARIHQLIALAIEESENATSRTTTN